MHKNASHPRSSPQDSSAEASLLHTALFYSMTFINEGLNSRHDRDAKISISPWVISAFNHIVSVSQPPDRLDKSVRTLGMRECLGSIFHAYFS